MRRAWVTPVGGNPGTTVGQQRLNAFVHAASIWGAALESPVPIVINSQFVPLTCTASGGTLGSAGALQVFGNFPNAPLPNTWYPGALANSLAGVDLFGALNDLQASFNSNIGTVGCLDTLSWYYGYDRAGGPSGVDLVAVLLHEFAHGLGFASYVNAATGAPLSGVMDVYASSLFDTTANLAWPAMTNVQRVASAINTGNLVWSGPQVQSDVLGVLGPAAGVTIVAPPATYEVGLASFGPSATSVSITALLQLASDLVTPADTLACAAIASVAGRIAVVDRGTCAFVAKVKNAQDAGAVAVIVVNNAAGVPGGMGGTDATITIPSVLVSDVNGMAINAALLLGPVTATIGPSATLRAGLNTANQMRLHAPNPLALGSSVSHWDPRAFPNQLMEPAINGDLTHSVRTPQDLSLSLMVDIGWNLALVPPTVPTE